MSDHKFDEVGPWSEVKLEVLQKYASAYRTVLKKQSVIQRVVYIDGFAGAGQHKSKSTGLMIPGSPQIALNVTPPFDEYHFVELNPNRAVLLEELAKNRSHVFVHHGDCNEILIKEVLPRCRFEDYARGLCLLDPYKLAVDWNVLAAAAAMKSVEVFYNFMIMDANMNMWKKNPDSVRADQIQRMNAVWGDDSWRKVGYVKRKNTLFDVEDKASNEQLAEAFRDRLEKVAGFKYVPQPKPMRNSQGAIVYYLFFASPNKTGAKIVKDIFESDAE